MYRPAILILLGSLAATPVDASQVASATGTIVTTSAKAPRVYVNVSPAPSQGGCHTDPDHHYAFDGTTPAGKLMMATVLTAQTSGRPVYIRGAGSDPEDCSLKPTVEDLEFIRLW